MRKNCHRWFMSFFALVVCVSILASSAYADTTAADKNKAFIEDVKKRLEDDQSDRAQLTEDIKNHLDQYVDITQTVFSFGGSGGRQVYLEQLMGVMEATEEYRIEELIPYYVHALTMSTMDPFATQDMFDMTKSMREAEYAKKVKAQAAKNLAALGAPVVKPILDAIAEGKIRPNNKALQIITQIYGEEVGQKVIDDYILKEQDPVCRQNLQRSCGLDELSPEGRQKLFSNLRAPDAEKGAAEESPELPGKPKADAVSSGESPDDAKKSQEGGFPWIPVVIGAFAIAVLVSIYTIVKSKK